ncbi:MAG: hypothetical protein FWC45_03675, partial [Treponema sp.]|nr:hypothetical protein [Treponema sp.]
MGGQESNPLTGGYPSVNMITMDVLKNVTAASGQYPSHPAPPSLPDKFFWNFYLIPGAEININYTEIFHSFSQTKIPVPMGLSAGGEWEVYAWTYVYLNSDGSENLDNHTPSPPPVSFEQTRWNVNWFIMNNFMYSYAEDSNHNGKIDRIRIQSAFDVEDGDAAFADFEIGRIHDQYGNQYSVDTSKGYNGYRRVQSDPAAASGSNDLDSIYVYIKEDDDRHQYTDGGISLYWEVIRNTSLRDLMSGTTIIGVPPSKDGKDPGDSGWTTDTIPPRINYALAVPGHNELFFQMSEPVNSAALSIGFPTGGWTGTLSPLRPGTSSPEFLVRSFENGSPPTVQDLVKGKSGDTFQLSNVQDVYRRGPQDAYHYYEGQHARFLSSLAPDITAAESGRALDKSDRNFSTSKYYFLYPIPKYPRTYNYDDAAGSGYDAKGFLLNTTPAGFQASVPAAGPYLKQITATPLPIAAPPNKVAVAPDAPLVHRLTDLLVSVPPSQGKLENYFVWPLWARYLDGTTPGFSAPGQYYNDPEFTDIITEFNGKRFLEYKDTIVLQARVNDDTDHPGKGLPAGALESLVFTSGSTNKALKLNSYGLGNGPEGLWLPSQDPASPNPSPNPDTMMFPYFTNLVPKRTFPLSLKSPDTAPPVPSQPLFNFTFPPSDFADKTELGFFFRLNSTVTPDPDLYAGRLDMAPGAAIPADWYRRVQPFSFGIHNVTRQRAGVTILNNVINSEKRERVFVDYLLTKSGRVTIQVFTLDGVLVKVLARENQSASTTYYRVSWDGTTQAGRPVARGMYFIRIVAPNIDEIRKVMVIK